MLQIVRERKRSLIFTPYKLLPAEFDSRKGAAVPTSRIREHRRFIQDVNNYLRDQIREVEAVVGWLENAVSPIPRRTLPAASANATTTAVSTRFSMHLSESWNVPGNTARQALIARR